MRELEEYSRLLDNQEEERRLKLLNTYNKKPPKVYEELYKTVPNKVN